MILVDGTATVHLRLIGLSDVIESLERKSLACLHLKLRKGYQESAFFASALGSRVLFRLVLTHASHLFLMSVPNETCLDSI